MSLPSSRVRVSPFARKALPLIRSFSTTLTKPQSVPPDSPLYIRLPTPPQVKEKKRERVRGFLPVPKDIFPRGEGERKLDPEYLNKTVPKPKTPQSGSAQRAWKAELAGSRRQGLEDGLKELWKRHSRDEAVRKTRSQEHFIQNHQRAVAPEREDDRLTRGTTLAGLLDTKVRADPERFRRARRSRKRVEAEQQAKKEARRDSLMELYISASNFITSESHLREEIDAIFSSDFFTKQSQASSQPTAENAWGAYGQPPSITSMLETASRTSTRIMDVDTNEFDRSAKRQKRIAEEFTGGKIE